MSGCAVSSHPSMPSISRAVSPASEPEEFAVGREIPLPQLAGLHRQAPGPLHADGLDPAGGTTDVPGEDVEAAADADDDRYVELLAIALAPGLLEGAGHSDEQH